MEDLCVFESSVGDFDAGGTALAVKELNSCRRPGTFHYCVIESVTGRSEGDQEPCVSHFLGGGTRGELDYMTGVHDACPAALRKYRRL